MIARTRRGGRERARRRASCLWPAVLVLGCASPTDKADTAPGEPFVLHARRQVPTDATSGAPRLETPLRWDPRRTAVVIVDMWDDHWCKGAAARVTELAGHLNDFVSIARSRGALIVHAPSTTVSPYEGTPARERAKAAPYAAPPVPLATAERWGTAWCWPDPAREGDLPIDDSDMGCDCEEKCEIRDAWSRQIDTIAIHDEDVVTDNGQELWNVFAERGIENVLILGVHLNMCVLGRPVGIRELVRLGRNVVLVRDLTDTMYNSHMRPFVDHFSGTDLVVEHVERHFCPTITSTDLTGMPPFRFKDDRRVAMGDER